MHGAWRTPLALLGLVLATGCAGINRWPASLAEPLAPPLQGRDLYGRWVTLEDYRGQVVLVDVWRSGCLPCLRFHQQGPALLRKYAGRPFSLLGINADADPAQMRQTLERKPVTWPTLWDGSDGPLATQLGVEAFPSLYLFDADGRLRRSWVGLPEPRELAAAIDGLLAEKR